MQPTWRRSGSIAALAMLALGASGCGRTPSGVASSSVAATTSSASDTPGSNALSGSPAQVTAAATAAATTAGWVKQSVALGSVTAITLDGSAVYLLYQPAQGRPAGADDPALTRVARLDRRSGQVLRGGQLPGASSIALSGASVWVAAGAVPTATDTRALYRLDPATLAVRQRSPLSPYGDGSGWQAGPVLAGGSASGLWLAYGRGLHLFGTANGTHLLARDLGAGAVAESLSIDPAGRLLYVGSANATSGITVTEWDADTGAPLASAKAPGGDLGGPRVSALGYGVWIAYATGTMGGIERLRSIDLRPVTSPPGPHSNRVRAWLSGRVLWLTDGMAQQLQCADPVTGAVRAQAHVNLPQVLAADSAGVYLGEAAGLDILRPDPSCNA
jgi:hypothetical protein